MAFSNLLLFSLFCFFLGGPESVCVCVCVCNLFCFLEGGEGRGDTMVVECGVCTCMYVCSVILSDLFFPPQVCHHRHPPQHLK